MNDQQIRDSGLPEAVEALKTIHKIQQASSKWVKGGFIGVILFLFTFCLMAGWVAATYHGRLLTLEQIGVKHINLIERGGTDLQEIRLSLRGILTELEYLRRIDPPFNQIK